MNAQCMAPMSRMKVFERFGVQFTGLFFRAVPIPRVQEFVRIVRNDSVQSFAAIIAPQHVVHENNPTPQCPATPGRDKMKLLDQRPFPVLELFRRPAVKHVSPVGQTQVPIERYELFPGSFFYYDRVERRPKLIRQFVCYFIKIDNFKTLRQIGFHDTYHRSARARRQGPSVLDRPWEAPKAKAEKAQRWAA